MKGIKIHLAWQILIALVLGIVVGLILHNKIVARNWCVLYVLNPAGDIFIRLMKMIVVPIVISTLIVGVGKVGDTKKIGRIGFKTIIYFEIITTIAIIMGIIIANIFKPGYGIKISTLTSIDISKYQKVIKHTINHSHNIINSISSLIPSNIFLSITHSDMLPIIFFSLLFGLGLSSLPKKTKDPLIAVCQAISESIFNITNIIMFYAPIGVFSLIAATVANFGYSALFPLLKLVLLVYCSIIFFALVILGIIARLCNLRIWMLIRILKDELILAYFTASSETVLPHMIKKMEAYGAPKSIVSLVLPTGYFLNLDGSSIYQSIAAIFVAQLYHIELSFTNVIMLAITLMITSKGIAGVPGASFVVLLSALGSIGIPLEGLVFLAGVDRIIDMARTALNIIGNALAVVVISKWENAFDEKKAIEYEKMILLKK
ncbi:Proton/glutamate-aspartate symporter [Candidatus Ecksteinia adelgidicola]|nr:Proton/glutamate-aspartate symporter [Candidatus Ecksteinia adelgidicola]